MEARGDARRERRVEPAADALLRGDGDRLDEMIRHLRLRGGPLDGMTWSGVIDVGKRVCCGTGLWSKECVYVVTDDTISGPDGRVESVATVPAHF